MTAVAPPPRLQPRGLADNVMTRMFPEQGAGDPVGWVQRRLGEFLWSKQREIMESVRDNPRTAVKSAHSTGKSHISSRIAGWWEDTHAVGDAFVVSTAPTQPQVDGILWRYIRQMHSKAGLAGRVTLDSKWYLGGDDQLVAFGRKPADKVDKEEAMQAFQGIHARYVLIILDEATGIPKWLWDAVETLASNKHARILAIGNPDDPASEFAKCFAEDSEWNQITISAFDTPAYTGEDVPTSLLELLVDPGWVEGRKKAWGEGSPLYISKVLGMFPDVAEDALVSPALIRAAKERSMVGWGRGRYGVDVASTGSDLSAIYRNRDGVLRKVLVVNEPDTMKFADRIFPMSEKFRHEVPFIVDVIGVGSGVADRLKQLGVKVFRFNGAKKASNPEKFYNLRAEMFWRLRQDFIDGEVDIDPDDDDLANQLIGIKWTTKKGRIIIEDKEETKKRLGVSPDEADAAVMTKFSPSTAPPKKVRKTKAVSHGVLRRNW